MKEILIFITTGFVLALLFMLALILLFLTMMYIDQSFRFIDEAYRALHMVLAWSGIPIITFTISRFLKYE